MSPAEIRRSTRRLRIRCQRTLGDSFAGQYQSAFKGAGIELEDIRPYQPGDDVRSIDWRVTARTGQPHLRVFRQERRVTVQLIVDGTASMNVPSPSSKIPSPANVAREVAAMFAWMAIESQDRVGLIITGEPEQHVVPPAAGEKHATRLIRDLCGCPFNARSANWQRVPRQLDRALSSRGIIVVISDFLIDDLSFLNALATRHEVVPVVVRHASDTRFPIAGLVRATDPETGQSRWLDSGAARVRDALDRSADALRALGPITASRRSAMRLEVGCDVAQRLHEYLTRRVPRG